MKRIRRRGSRTSRKSNRSDQQGGASGHSGQLLPPDRNANKSNAIPSLNSSASPSSTSKPLFNDINIETTILFIDLFDSEHDNILTNGERTILITLAQHNVDIKKILNLVSDGALDYHTFSDTLAKFTLVGKRKLDGTMMKAPSFDEFMLEVNKTTLSKSFTTSLKPLSKSHKLLLQTLLHQPQPIKPVIDKMEALDQLTLIRFFLVASTVQNTKSLAGDSFYNYLMQHQENKPNPNNKSNTNNSSNTNLNPGNNKNLIKDELKQLTHYLNVKQSYSAALEKKIVHFIDQLKPAPSGKPVASASQERLKFNQSINHSSQATKPSPAPAPTTKQNHSHRSSQHLDQQVKRLPSHPVIKKLYLLSQKTSKRLESITQKAAIWLNPLFVMISKLRALHTTFQTKAHTKVNTVSQKIQSNSQKLQAKSQKIQESAQTKSRSMQTKMSQKSEEIKHKIDAAVSAKMDNKTKKKTNKKGDK